MSNEEEGGAESEAEAMEGKGERSAAALQRS